MCVVCKILPPHTSFIINIMSLLEDIFVAYYDARNNKRNTTNQLRFELNLEENLIKLYHEINERQYTVGRSICFMITKPVKREVFAADFRDRIVHHVLFNYINPVFERTFICDSYSCRVGKGNLYGIHRLERHIRSCSKNYKETCYILKLDLSGYFMNINRYKLYDCICETMNKYGEKRIVDGVKWKDTPEYDIAMYLIPLIVFNDPVVNCYRKGTLKEWEGLPPSKSLFHTPKDCGLPIGNLTSQLFSNIYLNSFDQYVKRELGIRYYGRYVDDFYLVHNDKDYLLSLIPRIRDYLWESIGATLHPNKINLTTCWQGVDFVGGMVKPFRIYVKNRTKRNFLGKLYHYDRELGKMENPSVEYLEGMRSSINSYLGLMQHFRSYNVKKRMLERYPFVFKYGYLTAHMNQYVLKKELLHPYKYRQQQLLEEEERRQV